MKSIKPLLIITSVFVLLTACNSGYNKQDGKWVWISYNESNGKSVIEIDKHDFETFTVLDNEDYARDKNSVFYIGKTINSADPKTFEVLSNGYSKDINNVFLDVEKVIFADPKSFEKLKFPYSRDDNHVFCGTLPLKIEKNEVNEFIVVNDNELMSSSKTTFLLSHFIEVYPQYSWLDTLNINGVIVGEWAMGKTKERKFKGFKEVK